MVDVRRKVNTVLIIANLDKNGAAALLEEMRVYFDGRGIGVSVISFSGKPSPPRTGLHDLAISLGGDGTVLYCARLLAGTNIPVLPVNLGNFGFITEIPKEEWKDAFEKYVSGVLRVGLRVLLSIRVLRAGQEVFCSPALNDMVISSGGAAKLVRLQAFVSGFPIVRYRADGVIVSTPTGSTAYSAAAGGPMLHPEMEAMQVVPICPFSLSHRPLVIPASEEVSFLVEEGQRAQILLTADGQDIFPLREGDMIYASAADTRIGIVRSDMRSFYTVLKEKLGWSRGPDA
jgi:NAD+ kinase